MTCLDFINSIGSSTFKNYVEQHFDQIMALYNLCGASTITSIDTEINDADVSFNILFANTEDIVTMEYVLSTSANLVDVYGTSFSVDTETIDSNTLRVTMSPCV